jgi:hypothetical protein
MHTAVPAKVPNAKQEAAVTGHNLMQAIARVNRVYGDKPGGVIADLLGLADQLADALATYTRAGGTGATVLLGCNDDDVTPW